MKSVINKIIIFLLFSVLIIPSYVSAEECSNAELSRVRKLASLIKFETKYLGKQFEGEYGIHITGMSDEFYIAANKKTYDNGDTIIGLKPKESIKLFVYLKVNVSSCQNKFNYERVITMPAYNKYYKSDICVDNEDVPYCKMTYDTSKYSEEKFNSLVNDYIDSHYVEPVKQENNNYFIYIISGIAIIFVVVVVAMLFRKKRVL